MNWIAWLEKIAIIGFIFSFICSIYYSFISYKNKKIFFNDFDAFTEDNPEEIVSDEEAKEYMGKYNELCVKPVIKYNGYSILYIIFGGIAVLMHIIK